MVNQTTGDEIVYVNSLQPNDQLVWDDMYCYLNGELCTDSTNLAWMRLAPGWNEFKIYGYNKVDIRFHFRFVYLKPLSAVLLVNGTLKSFMNNR